MHKDVGVLLGASENDDFKARLLKLFDYLYGDSSKYYQALWSEVYNNDSKIVNSKWVTKITIKEDIVKKIYEAKPFDRLVKHSDRQEKVLIDLYTESFDQERASLFIYALKDTFHYPQYYPNVIEKIDAMEKSEELSIEWKLLKERHNTLKMKNSKWINQNTKVDSVYYEHLLKLAFSFQFDQLHEVIYKWEPKGHVLQKKQ